MKTADISFKPITLRYAKAYGRIRLSPETVKLIKEQKLPKGDLVPATKIAGLYGAKKTDEVLPFCHRISFDFLTIDLKINRDSVEVFSEVRGVAKTGYEMEALSAVSSALLNIFDMCKGVDSNMVIEEVKIIEKGGGKSDWMSDLKGTKFNLSFREDRLGMRVRELMEELGSRHSEHWDIFISSNEPRNAQELTGATALVSSILFTYLPGENPSLVKIFKDDRGRLIVKLPEKEEVIEVFFTALGPHLRSLL